MFMRRLVILLCLAGCAPSPEVVNATGGRELWNTDATKAPPETDADVTSVGPSGPGGQGGDGVGGDSGAGGNSGAGGDSGAGGMGGTDLPPATFDAGDQPVDAGPRGSDAASKDAPTMNQGPSATCTLSFQVTTVTFGGSYSPRNVGAIWISDANARFIKSLTVWGRRRLPHLETWEGVSGGSTVDAVTSATAGSHGPHMATWNCTGLDEKPVPNGTYHVNAEFTERNSEGKVMTPLTFTKSSAPVSVMPPDQANFKSIRLQVTSP
jgi:hypothetical protein